MADLPSSFSKLNDVEVRQDSINSESQYAKFGSNDNYLKDTLDSNISTRTSTDSSIQSDITAIKTEVNAKMVQIQKLVTTVTLGPFISPSPTPVAWGVGNPIPLNTTKIVPNFFALKALAPSVDTSTRIFLNIFYDSFDTVIYENTGLIGSSPITVIGLTRTQWDTVVFNMISSFQVQASFYKIETVSIP